MRNSDHRILDVISRNEEEGMKMLFHHFYRPLVIYTMQYLEKIEDAEDLVQNVFVNLWEKGQVKNIPGYLRTYLYRATRNASLNWLEKNIRNCKEIPVNTFDLDELMDEELPDDSDWNVYFDELYREIATLPPRTQEIFKAIILDNKKYQEVAEQFNISVNTVKTILTRGMNKLRLRLSKESYLLLLVLLYNNLLE